MNQKLARALLQREGAAVEIAADGRAGVEAWRRLRPDLILMDLQMPVLDGLAATREIRRAEGSGPRVPILALSANLQSEDLVHCREAGMDGHHAKPIAHDVLISQILAALRGEAPAR